MRCNADGCARWGVDSLGGSCVEHAPKCAHDLPTSWFCMACTHEHTDPETYQYDHRGDRDWLAEEKR